MEPPSLDTSTRVERALAPVARWARRVRLLLQAVLVVFLVGDLIMLGAVASLASGVMQWVGLVVVGAVLAVTLVALWLLVVSLGAVIELPQLLGEVAARHRGAGTEIVEDLRGRQGSALRRLAIREAIPVLRSAYDVRGASVAAVALVRLNPVFLFACLMCFLLQVFVLFLGFPLWALGATT